MSITDTITAISTGMTPAGIGIVRISGEKAIQIADKIYFGKHGTLASQKSHTIHYGYIKEDGKVLDQVLVSVMKAPHTFTGEDLVEINCHGGIYLLKKILECTIRAGAKLAEPGEFTKRAFLNGKIDLSQAEAVGEMISASNQYALEASISQLKGNEKNKIINIRNKIINNTAFIESALDDPEHISLEGFEEHLLSVLKEIKEEIKKLLSTVESGRIMKYGIRTVILGQPNVGKSSLLNRLAKQDRAIVTEIPGTTRDTLEETILFGVIPLLIVDTAGIRETNDPVEKIGIERAIEAAKNADLILYVLDGTVSFSKKEEQLLDSLQEKKLIVLKNKIDLGEEKGKKEELEKKLYKYKRPVLKISVKENIGLDLLEKMIEDIFFQGQISSNEQIYIMSVRHKEALNKSLEAILQVEESIKSKLPEDFYTIDLMEAYHALGTIIGETTGEDLINEIFSKFCMGK